MNDLQVSKANDLVDASYSLPAQAQKLVLACLAKVDSRKEIPRSIKLTAKEFSLLVGVDKGHAHEELYKAADRLFKSSIIIRTESEEKELCWVQEKVKKLKGEGAVTITWSDGVLQYISSLRCRFTSYKLRHISNLQSSHSIRLYELLMRFNGTKGAIKERVISLDDFKHALALNDKYPEYRDLNRWVIKPSVQELNKKSDIKVTVETIKKGKTVVSLGFSFEQNKQLGLSV